MVLALALGVLSPGGAGAEPASGLREVVDQSFSTTTPGAPTGGSYSGAYHAANNPNANPPSLRRIVLYPPAGMRFDTSVPDQCTATDLELEVRGPDACPRGSRIGSGTTEGLFFVPFAHAIVFDHFQHHLDLLNDANEQIALVHSEGYTVVRGHFHPDGSIEFAPPTCFPSPPTGQCADDYILQLKSANAFPPYTRASGGHMRSYATTPPTCPASGHWETTIKFWWADATADSVVSDQPCTGPVTRRSHRHRRRHSHRRRR